MTDPAQYNIQMIPEVALHRWVMECSRRDPKFDGYVGVLDVEKVGSPSFRSLLLIVRKAINDALRLETLNASGGTEHPPYHFDYIEVRSDAKFPYNAIAFQHEGSAFIVITRPFVELLFDLSQRLSRSPLILELLGIDPPNPGPDSLLLLLFQLQISFLVSHEYTHHVHRHVSPGISPGTWIEFAQDLTSGSIECQAQELDADAYAIYLVLGNFVRGAGRSSALRQLGKQHLESIDADALLLESFFLSLMSLFCARWPVDLNMASIRAFTHPPAPVRIEYAIRVAKMWCEQNQSVSESWFGARRFQTLFRIATEAIGGSAPQQWDDHIHFLMSAECSSYNELLFELFERLRTGKERADLAELAP